MPQNRYYAPSLHNTVVLKDDELHYMRSVMRLRVGETCEVIDGNGSLATCELVKFADKEALLKVVEVVKEEKEPHTITLAIAILKPSHLEYAIEKCCEVGATNFLLFPARRSEKKGLSEQYLKRLHTIILSATKQCGRLYLPKLEVKEKLHQCLEGLVLFGDLEATTPLTKQHQNVTLVIGPEAGFSPEERALLLEKGAKGVRFHRNTLRAETAAVVGIASL
ncbi:MAG: 16S rRNA (uracil(1498)-N(3))-methyltransferase [Verrucomicrobia bacterium]|nr:16S rRNA (uracil(1498)-N(3))-methyltransferase [Verrucomicrobiota bacterium]